MFDRLKPSALGDNAMLYKDLTQWLRNKTFVGLFFGLLLLAEGVSVFVTSLPTRAGEAGPVVFNILLMVLFFYGLIIAFSGYGLTAKEFQNRTFELYELSGMSLEKMIRGKFLSMMAQFLFGFFCIVPFLFFSYLLGGLDFYTILGVLLLAAILVPPLFLFSLAVALHSQKIKALATLFRVGAFLFLLWMGWMLLLFFIQIALRGGGGSFFNMGRIVKEILSGGREPLFCMGAFVIFHLQFCLLLFYLSCNAISPVTDSREGAVKFLATSFSLCLIGLIPILVFVTRDDDFFTFLFLVFLVECLMGLLYFWGPVEVPLMARRRQKESRWVSVRFLTYWFQPGPAGTFRTILLLWGSALLLYLFSGSIIGNPVWSVQEGIRRLLALLLAAPFWIATPGCFLLGLKRFRLNPVVMRMTLLLWWGFGGALMILALVLLESFRHSDSLLFGFLSSVLTPVSALIACLSPSTVGFASDETMGLSFIWIILGVIGMILMARTLAVRIRLDKMDRQAALQVVTAAEAIPERQEQPFNGDPLPPLPMEGVE